MHGIPEQLGKKFWMFGHAISGRRIIIFSTTRGTTVGFAQQSVHMCLVSREASFVKKEDLKEGLLQILELQLDYQLRAIWQLQGKPQAESVIAPRQGRRRQSLVDLTETLLTEERKPLHVNELVQLLQQRFGRLTDRDSLSSALAKKARRGILLRQSAPATFTLIDSKEDNHDTA
jgi:hypothetical protein